MADEATPAPIPEPTPYYPPPPVAPYYDPEAVKAQAFREGIRRVAPVVIVTYAMIVINVVVFIVMALNGVSIMEPTTAGLIRWGADYGPLTTHGEWWRMFTSTFVHIGVIHIVMNMVCLYMSGILVERMFGYAGFTVLYLLSGLGGSLASLMWNPMLVSAGASGAIFGVYGALFGFLLIQRNAVPKATVTQLAKGAGTFLAYNLIYGAAQSNTDVAAHIGGFLTGFVMGLALAQPFLASQASRLGRAVLVMALGLGGIAFCATQLPKADDLQAELKRFEKIESTAVDTFNDALNKAKTDKITPQAFADVIHNQVLPPWNAEIEAFRKMKLQNQQKLTEGEVVQYMTLRAEGWELIAKGFVNNDEALVIAANEKQKQAMAIINLLK